MIAISKFAQQGCRLGAEVQAVSATLYHTSRFLTLRYSYPRVKYGEMVDQYTGRLGWHRD